MVSRGFEGHAAGLGATRLRAADYLFLAGTFVFLAVVRWEFS
jgi:hypothetical protein